MKSITFLCIWFRFSIMPICWCCVGTSCNKTEVPSISGTLPLQKEDTPTKLNSGDSTPFFCSLAQIVARAPSYLAFEVLIENLGQNLPPEFALQIEKDGKSFPGMSDTLGNGSKGYVIGVQSDGALVIYILDGKAITFGYAFKSTSSEIADTAEKRFFDTFTFSNETRIEVLDRNEKAAFLTVKHYTKNDKNHIRAFSYGKDTDRCLTFYDSTKVEVSKLLPASPGVIKNRNVNN